MYYRLEVDFARMSEYIEPVDTIDEDFLTGAILDSDEIQVPYEFTMQRTGDSPLYDYYPDNYLMSERLVTVLQDAGVDNLQLFPCIIIDSDNKERINNYHVVNVIGLVSAANEEASISEELADVSYFHELVIHSSRDHGLFLFRLAESKIDILVVDDIAEVIADADLQGIVLTAVEEDSR